VTTTDPRQVPPPRDAVPLENEPPFDPLRLCVFTTVALLGWVLGPVAVLGFSAVAVLGYARARRHGLLRSRCKLGDTRIVLAYLVVVAGAAVAGIVSWVR
jgi:hypothetical protein